MSDIQDFVSDIPNFVEHEFPNVADINIEKTQTYKNVISDLNNKGYSVRSKNTYSVDEYNTCRNIFSRICEKAIKKGWKCNVSEKSIDVDVWNNVMLNVRK